MTFAEWGLIFMTFAGLLWAFSLEKRIYRFKVYLLKQLEEGEAQQRAMEQARGENWPDLWLAGYLAGMRNAHRCGAKLFWLWHERR
jgi:hypothetical protein